MYSSVSLIKYTCVFLHTCSLSLSLLTLCTHKTQCLSYFSLRAPVPPAIAEASDSTVNINPTLMTREALTLTCTAVGIPRPQIDWYDGDGHIINSSRIQINKIEIDETTLLSTLVSSSVTVGDSGTYECRVRNDAGTASLKYQVLVSECVRWCIVGHTAVLHTSYSMYFRHTNNTLPSSIAIKLWIHLGS